MIAWAIIGLGCLGSLLHASSSLQAKGFLMTHDLDSSNDSAQADGSPPHSKAQDSANVNPSPSKTLRDWATLIIALVGAILSTYLFFENRKMRSIQHRIEATEAVGRAREALRGDEDAIYSRPENPVDLQKASQLIEGALLKDPENPAATRYQAIIQILQGRTEDATKISAKAVALDPESFEFHLVHGNALCEEDKYEEALPFYQKAADLNPRSSLPLFGMGELFRNLNRYQEAAAMYEKAVENNPKDFRSYINLGFSLEKIGKVEDALEAYREGILHNRENGRLYCNLGALLLTQGRYEEAGESLQYCIKLDPVYLMEHISSLQNNLGEIQLVYAAPDNFQIFVDGILTEELREEQLGESRPYDEHGATKGASLWQIDDEAF